MATSQNEAEPLCDVSVLRDSRVLLVEKVNPDIVLPSVEPFLNYTQRDEIKAERNKGERVCKLLDILQLQVTGKCYVTFNAFVKALGGTQPDVFSSICGRLPTEEEADFCMQDEREQIEETIKAVGHTTDSEMDEQIDFEYEYVQLDLENRDFSKPGADRNMSVGDILGSEAEPKKKVLIFGRAGVGKTTTLQWMAREWAAGRWAAQFTMIFLLPVRFLINQMMAISTHELLSSHGLYQLASVSKHVASWLEHSASRVLILIDSLDEVPGFADRIRNTKPIGDLTEKALPIDLCINILRKNLLPQCTVISASRPFSGLSELCVDVKAEILGLTSTQVTEYIGRKHPSRAEHILSVLGRNPILLSVCSITYYCMLVSSLLSEGAIFDDEEIRTYTRLMAFILVQYASRKMSGPGFLKEVSPYLPKLAHLAYQGIFLSNETDQLAKIVFDEEDLVKSKLSTNDLESATNCGILQVSKSKSGRDQFITVEFFHLSVQELLAAAYFLENVSHSSDTLDSLFIGGQFDMCLTYMFGLHFDKESLWVKELKAAVNDSSTTYADIDDQLSAVIDRLDFNKSSDKLKACQLVYEGEWVEKARQIAHLVVSEGELCIEHTAMTAIDLLAVDFVCRCTGPLISIGFWCVNADDTLVNVMLSSLYKHNCQTLQELDLSFDSIQGGGAKAIAEMLASNTSLKCLILYHSEIGAIGAKAIAEMLVSNTSLIKLHISGNEIGDIGAEAIAEMLASNTFLTELCISANNIGDMGAKAIAEMLASNKSLTVLIMSYNKIGDVGAKAIAEMLVSNTSLTWLYIAHNEIGDIGAKAIAEMLASNTSLEDLYIYGNKIGAIGAKAIAEMLVRNTYLIELDISNNKIGDIGAQAIAEMLASNKSLTELDISDNEIGTIGAEAIAEMLVRNTSLIKLDISNNEIGTIGAQAIAEMLQVNTCLTTLDVSGNRIGDVGVLAVAAVLHENTTLTELDLESSDIGPDGHNALEDVCKFRSDLTVHIHIR